MILNRKAYLPLKEGAILIQYIFCRRTAERRPRDPYGKVCAFFIWVEEEMNRNQKIVVIIGLVIIVFMGLFPPWKFIFSGTPMAMGYKFLFSPPGVANVDSFRLLVQWLGVCIVVGGLVLILKDKDEK